MVSQNWDFTSSECLLRPYIINCSNKATHSSTVNWNRVYSIFELLSKLSGARGHFTFAGTPEQVTDLMEDWVNDGAADGFNLMPPVLPEMLDVFIAEVIPLLQKRGIFRTRYEGGTLRDHYGLPQPESRFD